ncbi:uncharacterized protein LOC142492590 [Ascaphus truei]|uniref:uncharacterized protein LOC142492590 n=1 Tax=Ascaphus truei TaxID=8439 RepID=UPI003F59DB65
MQIQVQKWFLGFALLFLWSDVLTVSGFTEIEIKSVTDQINKITVNFNKQYAYAAKFTPAQCNDLTDKNIRIALKDENAKDFLAKLGKSEIYQGTNLVAATFRKFDNVRVQHSEARLLFPANPKGTSPVESLLRNGPAAGCVLFYTLNSPCIGVCAKPNGKYNIIDQLNVFLPYKNRAFVYRDVYHVDQKNPDVTVVEKAWSEINKKMPLYRCFNKNCVKCFDNHNKFNKNCFN